MFSQLPWPERVALIEAELPAVLATLTYKSPTSLVIERLAKKLDDADLRGLSRTLLKLAPAHPLATHDGPEFKSYGQPARRWNWTPGDSEGWTFRMAEAAARPTAPQDEEAMREWAQRLSGFPNTVLLPLMKAAREKGDEASLKILSSLATPYLRWVNEICGLAEVNEAQEEPDDEVTADDLYN